jgi:PqqD family protein of HPr-rel-A system
LSALRKAGQSALMTATGPATVAMAASSDIQCWYAPHGRALLVRQWEEDALCVVYHPLNGDTHLLDPLPAELLRLLTDKVYTTRELLADLDDVFANVDAQQATDLLERSLTTLRDMGLVQADSNAPI